MTAGSYGRIDARAAANVPLGETLALRVSGLTRHQRGWGRNLTNAQYLTTVFNAVAQSGSVSGYPSQPRTYGVTGRFKF